MKHIITAIALAASTAASAGFFTGNDLLARMNGDEIDVYIARGFVMGVHDAGEGHAHCTPEVRASQISDVVKLSLQKFPERRHEPAWWFVHWALEAAYPCKKKGGNL
jgi:hypothetical protein